MGLLYGLSPALRCRLETLHLRKIWFAHFMQLRKQRFKAGAILDNSCYTEGDYQTCFKHLWPSCPSETDKPQMECANLEAWGFTDLLLNTPVSTQTDLSRSDNIIHFLICTTWHLHRSWTILSRTNIRDWEVKGNGVHGNAFNNIIQCCLCQSAD